METTRLFSKALLSLRTLLLITITILSINLTVSAQQGDLTKRIKIQELTIDDLKQENRNCAIMNQVLGSELKQATDSLSVINAKLSDANLLSTKQGIKISSLSKSKGTLSIFLIISIFSILIGGYFFFKTLKPLPSN